MLNRLAVLYLTSWLGIAQRYIDRLDLVKKGLRPLFSLPLNFPYTKSRRATVSARDSVQRKSYRQELAAIKKPSLAPRLMMTQHLMPHSFL